MKYKQIKKIGVEGFSENLPPLFFLFAYKRKKMFEKGWTFFCASFLASIFNKQKQKKTSTTTWFLFTQFDNLI